MLSITVFVAIFLAVHGQGAIDYRYNPIYDEAPKPYAFSYSAPLDDGVGQSSRTETADGSGRVQGSYTLNNDEGHYRVVEYIADQDGFRATVRTNEPGTENQSPADVTLQSEAGPAPYQYTQGLRRPVLNAAVVPAAAPVPVLEPVEVPENVLPPVRRPVYRRPTSYAARNYAYRPLSRVYSRV